MVLNLLNRVTRIGTFNLVSANGFLTYNDEVGQVQPLAKQPAGYISGTAVFFLNETSGYAPVYVDPSRGAILTLETRKKTLDAVLSMKVKKLVMQLLYC